jgi:hypothetical protein
MGANKEEYLSKKRQEIVDKYYVYKTFDTYEEAMEAGSAFAIGGKIGTADPVEYQVKVQDEVWGWK